MNRRSSGRPGFSRSEPQIHGSDLPAEAGTTYLIQAESTPAKLAILSAPKAAEDCRTPRRFPTIRQVLECGSPLPLLVHFINVGTRSRTALRTFSTEISATFLRSMT